MKHLHDVFFADWLAGCSHKLTREYNKVPTVMDILDEKHWQAGKQKMFKKLDCN